MRIVSATRVSLEDTFWQGSKEVANYDRVVTAPEIDTRRDHRNLSSSIGLFVLDHLRAQVSKLSKSTQGGGQRGSVDIYLLATSVSLAEIQIV
jgi:predicted DNA-binding ribbon-helix-helix protein